MAEYPIESWKKGFLAGLANPQPLMPLGSIPVGYLYNKYIYPALPKWDKDKYPNIIMHGTNHEARLICCKNGYPFVQETRDSILSGDFVIVAYNVEDYVYYSCSVYNGETEWTFNGHYSNGNITGFYAEGIIWTSCDIYHYGLFGSPDNHETKTLYREKSSDPVPVFE